MSDLVIRFVLGGAIVSLFAAIGETFQPKSVAGLFGAAPSVAVATLVLAYATKDSGYVALEARSMLLGAAALFVYSAACVAATKRPAVPVALGAAVAWIAWGAVAFAGWVALRAAGAA
jgi:uncharacterized membrane protein (GlpM family)